MASLYITEYASQAKGQSGDWVNAGEDPPIAEQKITFTGTAGQSANLNAKTRFVRIHVDGIAAVLSGANPTATVASRRMVAGQTEYFGVNPVSVAAGLKYSAITNT